jgi:hypothetical protein
MNANQWVTKYQVSWYCAPKDGPGGLAPAEADASNIRRKDRKMQVKTSSPVHSGEAVALAEMFKPARLNFAQVCLCCGKRWCESPACIALHDRTSWGPCERCDGFGTLVSCPDCCNGVVEITEATVPTLAHRALFADVDAFEADYVLAVTR